MSPLVTPDTTRPYRCYAGGEAELQTTALRSSRLQEGPEIICTPSSPLSLSLPLIRWISVFQAGVWDASWGVARQGKESPWLLCALHLSGLTLPYVLYKHQPLYQYRAEDHHWGCRNHCAVCCGYTSLQIRWFCSHFQQASLWGRKQKPRGWDMEITTFILQPRACFF